MEVAPFFVDFHHFLSIFTIVYRFSRFTHFCRDLHFVAIYALFPHFFLAKIAFSPLPPNVREWGGGRPAPETSFFLLLTVVEKKGDYFWLLSWLGENLTLTFYC